MATEFQVSFDADNPPELAGFWAQALGYVHQPPPPGFATWEEFAIKNNIPFDSADDYAALIDPDGKGPRFLFQRVPDGSCR